MPVARPRVATHPLRSARRLHTRAIVTPTAAILTLLAASAPDSGPVSPPLEVTVAVERISLPALSGPLSLRVDAYESTIALEAPRDVQLLARALGKVPRLICPTVQERNGEVQLRCRSRRVTAQLISFRGGRALDVRELSTLPWDIPDQGPPLVPFDPAVLGLGAPCPGDTLSARAECALAAGRRDEAQQLFRQAISTPEAPLAALRLGDLAFASGNPVSALVNWSKAARHPPWHTIAHQRICELDPKCLSSSRAGLSLALEEVARGLRTDALLRAARREAFQGRALEAAAALAVESGPDGACASATSFCRRILLAALREPGPRGAAALTFFLDVPDRDRGPYAVELARAAAEHAEAAGAPVFAANLLVDASRSASPDTLPWLLLRAVELYRKGQDATHAQLVSEYARARFDPEVLRQPRWRTILQSTAPKLGVTAASERIPLPSLSGSLSLRVDAYESIIALEAPRDVHLLARSLGKIPSLICPVVQEHDGEVQLRCRSRRLSVQLVSVPGGRALDVRELSALPWDIPDQSPLLVPFDPAALGLGAPCPGDTLSGRAECALAAGRLGEAQRLFRNALSASDAPLAAIRLGDLALAAGDTLGAFRNWDQVSPDSSWGAIAQRRLCELDAKCLSLPRTGPTLAPEGLSRTLRTDALLRVARRDAFQGRALEAATTLAGESGPDGACANASSFCRRVLLAALREPGARGIRALRLYLDTPNRDRGPYRVELVRAAAERAEEAEAPVFGANLMAVVAGEVGSDLLPWHLLRTVELYLAGQDRAHARLVSEFARARLGPGALRDPRWRSVLRSLSSAFQGLGPQDRLRGIEADLAAAHATLATAKSAPGGKQ
jgi:tetratricopeptide (TPR) repeat protein